MKKIIKPLIMTSFVICMLVLLGCSNLNANSTIDNLSNNLTRLTNTLNNVETINTSELIIDNFVNEYDVSQTNTSDSPNYILNQPNKDENGTTLTYFSKLSALKNSISGTVVLNNEVTNLKTDIITKAARIKELCGTVNKTNLSNDNLNNISDLTGILMINNTRVNLSRNETINHFNRLKSMQKSFSNKPEALQTKYLKLQSSLNTRLSYYKNMNNCLNQIEDTICPNCDVSHNKDINYNQTQEINNMNENSQNNDHLEDTIFVNEDKENTENQIYDNNNNSKNIDNNDSIYYEQEELNETAINNETTEQETNNNTEFEECENCEETAINENVNSYNNVGSNANGFGYNNMPYGNGIGYRNGMGYGYGNGMGYGGMYGYGMPYGFGYTYPNINTYGGVRNINTFNPNGINSFGNRFLRKIRTKNIDTFKNELTTNIDTYGKKNINDIDKSEYLNQDIDTSNTHIIKKPYKQPRKILPKIEKQIPKYIDENNDKETLKENSANEQQSNDLIEKEIVNKHYESDYIHDNNKTSNTEYNINENEDKNHIINEDNSNNDSKENLSNSDLPKPVENNLSVKPSNRRKPKYLQSFMLDNEQDEDTFVSTKPKFEKLEESELAQSTAEINDELNTNITENETNDATLNEEDPIEKNEPYIYYEYGELVDDSSKENPEVVGYYKSIEIIFNQI